MARTHGQGNPKWSREETILALDLYFDLQGNIPPFTDIRIQQLSTILRQLSIHETSKRKDSFRNAPGVAFKLLNIQYVATGRGLNTVSKMDNLIWTELGQKPNETKAIANLIRTNIEYSEITDEVDENEDFEFFEGRTVTRNHRYRERNSNIRKKAIKVKKLSGHLCCEICGCVGSSSKSYLRDSIFEVHHIIPVAVSGPVITSLREIALLCANCHRSLHRLIANNKQWYSIPEAIIALK
jgi:5-methylcytosine-specific restriction enzyme A